MKGMLSFWLVLMAMADILLTAYALRHGYHEVWVFSRLFFAAGGWGLVIALHCVTTPLAVWWVQISHRVTMPLARALGLASITLVWTFPVVWGLTQLFA